MNVRLEIKNPEKEIPELTGLWIKGFGWLVGGDTLGDITIYGKIVPTQSNLNLPLSGEIQVKKQTKAVKKFLARIEDRSFGDKLWKTK